MKTIATCALFLGSSSAAWAGAAPQPDYHCEYRLERAGGKVFTMNGNIETADATTRPGGATYLTLEPPHVSGLDVTARVLITYWTDNGTYFYNPMTLHPRGDTAHVLASAELTGDGNTVTYQEGDATYTLTCKARGH